MNRTLGFITVLLAFGAIQAHAQACGYVFSRIYVNDSSGASIRNVRFEFLENQDRKNWAVHGRNVVKWVEADSRYFLEEGMCGGHRDVLVKVSADGFKEISKVLDLHLRNPRRPYVFRIMLERTDAKDDSSFTTYSFLTGRIFDANGAVITSARVRATDSSGNTFATQSDDTGEYVLELPYNQYESGSRAFREAKFTIKVEKEGFKPSVTKDFVFIPSQFGEMKYDIGLEIQSYSHPIKVKKDWPLVNVANH